MGRSLQFGRQLCRSIRIFIVCKVRIQNSITRVSVRHHEACRVIPNSYPEWRFSMRTEEPLYIIDSFVFHTLLSTIVLKLGYALFWSNLRCNKYIFSQEMFGLANIYDVLTSCTRLSYPPPPPRPPPRCKSEIQNGWKSRKTLSGMQKNVQNLLSGYWQIVFPRIVPKQIHHHLEKVFLLIEQIPVKISSFNQIQSI